MLEYLLFIPGLFFLYKGADWLVDGASSIARKWNVPEMVVGLTIVSFGTSMPELTVNIISSINGNSDIALGNVFGSNIANVLLILGLSAIICPLPLKRNTIYSEIPFAILASFLVGFLANASFFDTKHEMLLSRFDGGVLLFFFCLFMIYIFRISKQDKNLSDEKPEPMMAMKKSIIFILIGVTALFLGGRWTVNGAVRLATDIGLSESFVGLTIVAVGTSLPELFTSVIAARKKNIDIAVGNVIGSNIFNLLWILGVSALISPLPFSVVNNFDVYVMAFSVTLIIPALFLSKQYIVSRISGVLFVLIYFLYLWWLIVRG